jgi:four helix bundle protein
MRDHRKLEVFGLADNLTLHIYEITRSFPTSGRFGLTNQIRRAAVSIGTNIVEGSARMSEADYVRFLNIAYASACELEYELSLAVRLGYIPHDQSTDLADSASRTCRALRGLIGALTSRPGAH